MLFYTFKVLPPDELFIAVTFGDPQKGSQKEVIKLCFIYKDGTYTANLQKRKSYFALYSVTSYHVLPNILSFSLYKL